MATMPFIPFGPWAPDRSEFNTEGTEQALNVIRTSNGYRPFPGLADSGFASLPDGQPTGLFFGKDISGNAWQFATVFNDDLSTGFYELDVNGSKWDRVGVDGISSKTRFQKVQFDDDLFVANFSDNLRTINLGATGAFAKVAFVLNDLTYQGVWNATRTYTGGVEGVGDEVHFISSSEAEEFRLYRCTTDTLAGESPDTTPGSWIDVSQFVKPKFIATIRDILFGCFMEDPVVGLAPNRARWSALGQPLVWSLNGSADNLSDFQDIPDAGECRGIVGGEFGTLLMENGIFRVDFVGPPNIFTFQRLENARGCSEPNSVVTEGQNTYYLADDGWAKFDGQVVTPIGAERFDRWFARESAIQTRENMTAKVDPQNQLIIWGFDSGTDATDVNDTALIYDYVLTEPSYARFPHSLLGDFVSPGFDLEDLTSLVINDPALFLGAYDNVVQYEIGERVTFFDATNDPLFYQCIVQSTGNLPTDTNFWTPMVIAPNYKGPWQTNGNYNRYDTTLGNADTRTYAIGDRVSHELKIWEAIDATPFNPAEEPGEAPGTSWLDKSIVALPNTEIMSSVDDLTTSLDGVFYKAGAPTFGALKTNRLFTFTGIPDVAQIDTSERRLGEEKRAKVQFVQTAIEGLAQDITVQIGTRNRLGKAVDFGPERELTVDGQYAVLRDSRYQRVRVNITSTDTVSWSDATGVFVRFQVTSLR